MGDFTIQITGLTEQTTYYYQMYAIIDNIYYYGETKSFTTTKDVIYQTGDWYPNIVSPIGIVFYTANSGRSGKIVSLDYETGLAWDANGENSKSASCSSTTDGSNNDMPKDSPVAKWVANHGSGWYCPSRSELVSLNNNLFRLKADKEKTTEKIDGAIATIMALDRAVRCGNVNTESVYDSRGILFI